MKPVSSYFKNPQNLQAALYLRSYCNEHPGIASNERLEFLGDSVLSLVMTHRLYNLYPNVPEGELTGRRSLLVQTTTLAEKARLLGLDELMLISKGEDELGGRTNPSLLADTFEAVLGALFLAEGLPICYEYLTQIFPDTEIQSLKEIKDPKSSFQELAQAKGLGTPSYQLLESFGPDHAKTFISAVLLAGKQYATGTGKSIQKAETEAAKSAMVKLQPSS